MELWNYGAARSIWAHFSSPVFKLKIQLVPSQSSSQSSSGQPAIVPKLHFWLKQQEPTSEPVNLSIYQCQIGWLVIDHLTICISVKVKPVMLKNTVSYQFKVLLIANRVPIPYQAFVAFQVWHFIFNIQSRKVTVKFIRACIYCCV